MLLLSLMVMPSQAALQVFNQDFLWDNTNGIYWSRDTTLGGMMNGGNALSWIDDLNAGLHPDINPAQHNGWRLPSYGEMSVMYNDYYGAYLNDSSYAGELEDGQGNLIIQTGGYWATPFVPGFWGMSTGYEFNFLGAEVSSGPNDYGGNYSWLVSDVEPASLPTPIPGSLWLVTSGFMGLVAFRRRLAD